LLSLSRSPGGEGSFDIALSVVSKSSEGIVHKVSESRDFWVGKVTELVDFFHQSWLGLLPDFTSRPN